MAGQNIAISDPSGFGFPPGLPIELALREHPVAEICAAYGLSQTDFARLKTQPHFLDALQEAVDMLKTEGASFRLKARVQAEGMLKKTWEMVHAPYDQVPANVKAELIKHTVRVAGLDASLDQKAAAAAHAQVSNALQINIHLD